MTRFTGAAVPLTEQGIQACADTLSVHPAELWAVLQIETRGCGYFADRRPAILFERHVFSRRTNRRFDEQAPDISNPRAGGYARGPAEYARLERAQALDEQAALESASWGLGQVMGYHAKDLGYGSVEQFVSRMMASEDEQLAAMATFIQRNGLDKALRDHDWAAFARGYNGPGYVKQGYDRKLEAAHRRHAETRHGAAAPPALLRHGSAGEAVSNLQRDLAALGSRINADGVFGPTTEAAVRRLQADCGLAADGIARSETLAALGRVLAARRISREEGCLGLLPMPAGNSDRVAQ